MRCYSEVLAAIDRRGKSHPSCLFVDGLKFGEHRTVGREEWDTDIGKYFQIDIGLETRRWSFQLTVDEAKLVASRINIFLSEQG